MCALVYHDRVRVATGALPGDSGTGTSPKWDADQRRSAQIKNLNPCLPVFICVQNQFASGIQTSGDYLIQTTMVRFW